MLLVVVAQALGPTSCADLLDPVEEMPVGAPIDCGNSSALARGPEVCAGVALSNGHLASVESLVSEGSAGEGGTGTNAEVGALGGGSALNDDRSADDGTGPPLAIRFSGGVDGGVECDDMEFEVTPLSGPVEVTFIAPDENECDGDLLAGPVTIDETTRLGFPVWQADQTEWLIGFESPEGPEVEVEVAYSFVPK